MLKPTMIWTAFPVALFAVQPRAAIGATTMATPTLHFDQAVYKVGGCAAIEFTAPQLAGPLVLHHAEPRDRQIGFAIADGRVAALPPSFQNAAPLCTGQNGGNRVAEVVGPVRLKPT